MRRTFIVGCPRSGTTVVQAMLARHPDVFTLPETAFFEHLLGDLAWRWGDLQAVRSRPRLRHRMGFARQRGRMAFTQIMAQLGTAPAPARSPVRTETCIRRFIATLDEMTESAGHDMWVEKTPNHLLYIPEIRAHMPDAQFVHVIRSGMDVLASLADANLRYDDNHGFSGDAKHWARRWNHAVEIHRRHIGQPNHHFIFLDDFVGDTDREWRRLCRFLDLSAEVDLQQQPSRPIADPVNEPWKQAALGGRPRITHSKVEAMFGPELQRWLEGRLASYDQLHALWKDGLPGPRRHAG
jgi:hypothetical protein